VSQCEPPAIRFTYPKNIVDLPKRGICGTTKFLDSLLWYPQLYVEQKQSLSGGNFAMHHHLYILFAIPLISMIVIGLSQMLDETFKKEFVLERRQRPASEEGSTEAPRRRYSDAVPGGGLRHPEAASSEAAKEAPVVQIHGA
jgi:hypothetical protein